MTKNKQDISKKNILKRIIFALGIVMVLQVADYFIANITYPLLDSVDPLMILDYYNKKGDAPDKDVVFVNVGYDKSLVTALEDYL